MQEYERPLTNKFVQRAHLDPGKYYHKDGIFLRVRKSGSRYFEQRITIEGKRRNTGLGPSPVITLEKAEQLARRNRCLVDDGKNPIVMKQAIKQPVPTIEELAPVAFKNLRPQSNPKQAKVWLRTLEKHVFAHLGKRMVSEVTPADILKVLMLIWHQKPAMARNARRCLRDVMAYAIGAGYRSDNPAGKVLRSVLPRNTKQSGHHRAIPHADVPTVLAAVREARAMKCSKLAHAFIVFTAARSAEVRFATWDEIDFDARVWTIPAARMKVPREHQVPLSPSALAILAQTRKLGDGTGLIFPSRTGRPISHGTLSNLLNKLDFDCVPHGFRSTFRDWCGDTGVSRELAEGCLAHVFGDPTQESYKRSKWLEQRRPILERWAAYVAVRAAARNLNIVFCFDEI